MADDSEERNRKSKSRSKSRKRTYHKNPFLNFVREFRELPEQQNTPSRLLFKLAGERWRSLSDSDREPYVSQAQIAKEEPRNYVNKVTRRTRRMNLKKRKCSRCGHRHGSPMPVDSEGETTRDDDENTSASSRSRSRSPSRSKSKSDSKSGSVTTGDDFDDETTTTF